MCAVILKCRNQFKFRFQCAIAVSPVTDWRYYDAAYSERYMGLAPDNMEAYDNASVVNKVELFHGKKVILVTQLVIK